MALAVRGISYLSDAAGEARLDVTAIRDELGCDAVLIKGSDAGRQLAAAQTALELGLDVWIEAQRENASARANLAHLAEVATAA